MVEDTPESVPWILGVKDLGKSLLLRLPPPPLLTDGIHHHNPNLLFYVYLSNRVTVLIVYDKNKHKSFQ